jgi:CheY-like chemotaxis protein
MALWTLKDQNILIVDDFPEMRAMMRSMLIPFGANKLHEARNGQEAVDAMEKQTMEIVMCDYSLGAGKDGQQVLEEAKERNLLPYSSIFVLVTAENTSNMVMGAMEYQPDEYLVKPFTKTVLQARLKKVQERKDGFREIAKALDSKKLHLAIDLCDRQLATGAKNVMELIKLKGELLVRTGEYAAAQALYQKALEAREFTWARFGLGQCFYHLTELQQARLTFEQLLGNNNKFVAGYDWLAKVQKALGDTKAAMQLLTDAVAISPKAILRQRVLAETALESNEVDIAEKAYKNVVREGKNSVYRSPTDFGGLAKVYLKKENAGEANKVVAAMATEFQKGDAAVQLQTSVIQALVYKDTGNEAESAKALDRVMALYAQNPGNLPTATALELAEASYALGKGNHGAELIKHVVRNNHEDTVLLEKVKELCAKTQDASLANIVENTCAEVIATNNKGVEMIKQGKIDDSIGLFMQAARAMPENITINLNAALSLIAFMQKNGLAEKPAQQTEQFLERVMRVAPGNERYKKVLQQYRDLLGRNGKAG